MSFLEAALREDRDNLRAENTRLTAERDQARAALGLAYETAAKVADDAHSYYERQKETRAYPDLKSADYIANEIRDLDPDATAALEAHDKRVRDEETRACADAYLSGIGTILSRLDQRKEETE